jgi:transposase
MRQGKEGQFSLEKGELMARKATRRFSREFKLSALRRLEAGERPCLLAADLGIGPQYLYAWRERFRAGGAVGLRSCGRPTKAEAVAMRAADGPPGDPQGILPAPAGERASLARAARRIAELERKIGEQQVELDFFRRALRQVRGERRGSGAPGGTPSTRSSKR